MTTAFISAVIINNLEKRRFGEDLWIKGIWEEVQGRMRGEGVEEEFCQGEQRNELSASKLWSVGLSEVKRGYFKDWKILIYLYTVY